MIDDAKETMVLCSIYKLDILKQDNAGKRPRATQDNGASPVGKRRPTFNVE
jgi:hypothetical protein